MVSIKLKASRSNRYKQGCQSRQLLSVDIGVDLVSNYFIMWGKELLEPFAKVSKPPVSINSLLST